ncbi:hypothetical protein JCM5350_004514 [Sporobolomyces pararoseus]
MYTSQDLTDRLQVATEESDVVFVIVWLSQMREQNCLEPAINSPPSRSPPPIDLPDSTTRIETSPSNVVKKELEDPSLSLSISAFSPLSELSDDESFIESSNVKAETDSAFFSPFQSQSFDPFNNSSPSPEFVRLHVGPLPFGFSAVDVTSLFNQIGVSNALVDHCQTNGLPAFAFVQVPKEQAQQCVFQLDASPPPALPSSSSVDPFYTFPPSQSPTSYANTFSLPPSKLIEHNLLVLNLPLEKTTTTLEFLSNLPNHTFLPQPAHSQSVAFVKAYTLEKAEEIKSLWNRSVVEGKFLEIVDAKSGLLAEQAIEEHLSPYSGSDQIVQGATWRNRREEERIEESEILGSFDKGNV